MSNTTALLTAIDTFNRLLTSAAPRVRRRAGRVEWLFSQPDTVRKVDGHGNVQSYWVVAHYAGTLRKALDTLKAPKRVRPKMGRIGRADHAGRASHVWRISDGVTVMMPAKSNLMVKFLFQDGELPCLVGEHRDLLWCFDQDGLLLENAVAGDVEFSAINLLLSDFDDI